MEAPLTMEELDEELCEYCPCTEFGTVVVNSAPYNLCEGRGCKEAYVNYIESGQEDVE